MPTYTKESLKKLLEGEGDVTLFDKDEVNRIVQERLAELGEKKIKPAESTIASLTAERDKALAELRAIRSEAENAGKSAEQKWADELKSRDAQINAWKTKHTELEASVQALAEQRKAEYRQNALLSLFSREGPTKAASPATAVREAIALAAETLALEENGHGLRLRALDDPQIRTEIPLEKWAENFLTSNPHLRAAAPSGAPLSRSQPTGERTKDPLEGLTSSEMFKVAARDRYGKRKG